MKRKWSKRSQLEEFGLRLEINEKGEYQVYRNDKLLKTNLMSANHKYGRTITYVAYTFYLGKENGKYKYATILEHVLVWLWFKGDIPEGYDVDHIDNDKLNNKIENLQLLTRKENLAKRGVGRNQYSYHLSDEEILAMRELKKRAPKVAEELRKHKQLEFAAKTRVKINKQLKGE